MADDIAAPSYDATEATLMKLDLLFEAFWQKIRERQCSTALKLHPPPAAQRSKTLPKWNGATNWRRMRPRRTDTGAKQHSAKLAHLWHHRATRGPRRHVKREPHKPQRNHLCAAERQAAAGHGTHRDSDSPADPWREILAQADTRTQRDKFEDLCPPMVRSGPGLTATGIG
ncbi:Hypothetical predicted protein [Pelobates cultripes]|uniref:Uncharacterized protein n=1 Tax=Pelobates cultripes TaxID=61616 RepID=A0AAD1WPN0_PELCU|nr:Hypothetical predicted protein [Pelobates cultripes]